MTGTCGEVCCVAAAGVLNYSAYTNLPLGVLVPVQRIPALFDLSGRSVSK